MSTTEIAVGFDVGGTNVRGVALRADGTVGTTVLTPRPDDPDQQVEIIAELVGQLGESERAAVTSVGVGYAGIVDAAGVVRTSPNIPSLVRFPLKSLLDQRLGLATVVDNDATAAVWAETRLGAARGSSDVVLVALGTGIGTGFVLGGRLHRGASGFAGESGHMTIVHDGIACVCGRRGCWERYASGTALRRLARDAAASGRADGLLALAGGNADDVAPEHAAQLAASGDSGALAVLAELGHWTALGIANLVSVLDPSTIVLGGGLADIGEPYLRSVRQAYPQVAVDATLRDPVAIELSHFGSRSGAVGVAMLAAERT